MFVALSLPSFLVAFAADEGGFPGEFAQLGVQSIFCTVWQPLQADGVSFTIPASPGNVFKGGLLLKEPLSLIGGHEYLFVIMLRTKSSTAAPSLPSQFIVRNQGGWNNVLYADGSSRASWGYQVAGFWQYTLSARVRPDTDWSVSQPVIEAINANYPLGTGTAQVWCYAIDVTAAGGTIDWTPLINAINKQTSDLNENSDKNTSTIIGKLEELLDAPDSGNTAAGNTIDSGTADVSSALSPLEAVDNLSSQLDAAFKSSGEYTVHFPGLSGPFMPDGSTVTIIQPQDVDLSFLDRFSVLTSALGVVALGLCGWKTLAYMHGLLMRILGGTEGGGDE